MQKQIYILALTLMLVGCSYNRFDPLPGESGEGNIEAIAPTIMLNELVERFARGEVDLEASLVMGGIVTTSDSTGNIYKSLVIQQDGIGVAVLTGTYDTYASFRRGEKVAVRLDGLRMKRNENDGILSIGAPVAGSGNRDERGVDYIGSEAVVRRIVVRSSSNQIGAIQVPTLTIAEVTSDRIGQLVRVTGGEFTQGGVQTWGGEKTYSEKRGTSLTVYTSLYATFANDLLPAGKVDLTGIVTEYRGKLQLKISSPEDCTETEI